MKLTSKISHYDSRWPALFVTEKERMAKGLGTELVGIYHVGSTAVPGLAAKPEIDLLVEVSEHRNEPARDSFMSVLGYVRGSDLSAGHHFYRRDVDGVRTHKVHVCVSGHWQIESQPFRHHNVSLSPLRRTLLAFKRSSTSVFSGIYLYLFATNNLSFENK
ncbi:GrpB family protein [Cupriavidus basilensis]|uniref:GrpB family protein n=1 Tax=Cupriavidus basilensis TaxID=68895 RepID=UPI0020C73978|nr:GrpB family protein [Cupriavidus basilensis]